MTLNLGKVAKAVVYGWLSPRKRLCCACGRKIGGFIPYRQGSRSISDAIRAFDVSGSDLDNFECPRCGANDRLRHLLLYMTTAGMFNAITGSRVLHFAPERRLVERIRDAKPQEYIQADIDPGGPDVTRVDMTAMAFSDASFDIVIANHVLEHVHNLPAALAEVGRVLAPGGVAILQTPFSTALRHRFEDAGIVDDEARSVLYGQEDHVRLFGSDIADEVSKLSGLMPLVRTHAEALPGIDAWTHGVNSREPFLTFVSPLV